LHASTPKSLGLVTETSAITATSPDGAFELITADRSARRSSNTVRRTADVVVSLAGLILALPIAAIVAIAIRLDSPGPIVFRQTRIGRNGKPFTFYKFRGMFVDAHKRWPELYAYSYAPGELDTLRFHPAHDPRVTRVGRSIRRTSVDEILNLWNVLLGDMTLVGPRPEIPEMLVYYGDARTQILAVKPGVTSLAKVTGRDELTFGETLRLDLEYLRRRSLLLDLKILGATVLTVLLQRGVLAG
jgi:lipopolysaccharide/colanic/teichoic acid biosynthesis glycosyltransferase